MTQTHEEKKLDEKSTWAWVPYVIPFAVYMLVGSMLDVVPDSTETGTPSGFSLQRILGIDAAYAYPAAYTIRIVVTLAALLMSISILRRIPFRVLPLAVALGAIGAAVWIGLCSMGIEAWVAQLVGYGTQWSQWTARPSYNPDSSLGASPSVYFAFLAVRFLGLVAVVPVIEELFLRGFLVRFVSSDAWWRFDLRQIGPKAYAICAAYGALTHPGEILAAIAWFSIGTWLMLKTGNIWDCIVTHATTNLLLGVYVIAMKQWWLW